MNTKGKSDDGMVSSGESAFVQASGSSSACREHNYFTDEAHRLHDEVLHKASSTDRDVDAVRQDIMQRLVQKRSAQLKSVFVQELLLRARRMQRVRFDFARELEKMASELVGGNDIASTSSASDLSNTALVLSCVENGFAKEFDDAEYSHSLCPSAEQFARFYVDAVSCRALQKCFASCGEDDGNTGHCNHAKRSRQGRNTRTRVVDNANLATVAEGNRPVAGIVSEALGCLLASMSMPLLDVPYRSAALRACAKCAQSLDFTRSRFNNKAMESASSRCTKGPVCIDIDAEAEEDVPSVDSNDGQHMMSTRSVKEPVATDGDARDSCKDSNRVPYVSVPCLLSLNQYCADAPWVVEMCGLGKVETKGAEALGSSCNSIGKSNSMCSANSFSLGFHFQIDHGGCDSAHKHRSVHCLKQTCVGFAQTSDSAGHTCDEERYTYEGPFGKCQHKDSASEMCGTNMGDCTGRKREDTGSWAHSRIQATRNVVSAVRQACDHSWAALLVPPPSLPSCACEARSGTAHGCEGDTTVHGELDNVHDLLDAVRLRFVVEVSARIVALETAKRMVMESELSPIFDGVRSIALCVSGVTSDENVMTMGSTCPCASTNLEVKRQESGTFVAGVHGADTGMMPISVLELPNTVMLFYCIVYCIGAALLRDHARHSTLLAPKRSAVQQHIESHDGVDVLNVDCVQRSPSNVATRSPDLLGGTVCDNDTYRDDEDDEGCVNRFLLCMSRHKTADSYSFLTLLRVWLYLCEFILQTQHNTTVSMKSSDVRVRKCLQAKRSSVAPPSIMLSKAVLQKVVDTVISAFLHRAATQTVMLRRPTRYAHVAPSAAPVTTANAGEEEDGLSTNDTSRRIHDELFARLNRITRD